MADRLDNVGLSYLWNKLKAYFASKTQLANDLKGKADAIITNSDPKASFSPGDIVTYGEEYRIIVDREEGFAGIAYADTESVMPDADQGADGIFTVTGPNIVHIEGEPSSDATLDITVYGETAFEPETAINEDDALHFGVYLTGTITGSGDPIEITLTLTPEEGTADVHTFTVANSLGLQQFSFTAGCDAASVSMSITAATGFEYDAYLSWGAVIGEEYTAQTFGTDDEMVFDSSDIAADGISFLGLPGYAEYTADTKTYVDGSAVEYSNATTSAAGLMSAEDKTKLDQLAPNTFTVVGFTITQSQWTLSNSVYTYTFSNNAIGDNTTEDVYFDESVNDAIAYRLSWGRSGNNIVFSTPSLPVGNVVGTVRILGSSSEHRIVEFTGTTIPISKGGTGAANAAGALSNLGIGNVENKSSATIRDEITSANVVSALGYTPLSAHQSLDGKKSVQAAVSDPTASGTSVTFIATLSQNTQGVISATKKTVSSASTSAAGLMSAEDKTKLNGIAAGAQVNPGNATTSAAGLMSADDKTKLNGIDAGAQVNPGNATTTSDGLMSASDKIKLNRLESVIAISNTINYAGTVQQSILEDYSDYVVIGGYLSDPRKFDSDIVFSSSGGSTTITVTTNAAASYTIYIAKLKP